MICKLAIKFLVALALSGCIASHQIPSEIPHQLEDIRTHITPGKSSRKEVQAQLGDAFISEENLEVYRVISGHDIDLLIALIPIWETEEVILYALVVYDDDDVVDVIEWAIYQHDSHADPGNNSPWLRSARLQAGDFYFAAFNTIQPFKPSSRKEFLLAPESISLRGLEKPPPSGMCAVLFFLKEMENSKGYERMIFLDGEPIVEMPLVPSVYWAMYPNNEDWNPYYQRIFTKHLVTEGEHELTITTRHRPHEFRSKLECKGGDAIYVYPRHKLTDSEPYGVWRARIQVEGDIEIYDQPIEPYDGWKRLLFYSGKWFSGD